MNGINNLNSIANNNLSNQTIADNKKEVIEILLDDIVPNRFQPRLTFDQEALNELAMSIKEHGIIQPLIVRKLQDKFEIIAGERRFKAASLAGLSKVPCIVMNLDDNESAEVAVIENIQRKEMTPLEEAKSFKKILDKGYITQDELAKKLGKNQSTIANKLRLLNLDDTVQDAILNEKISERHARSLLKIEDKNEQRNMLKEIIEKRLTVRQLDDLIKEKYGKVGDVAVNNQNSMNTNMLNVTTQQNVSAESLSQPQVNTMNGQIGQPPVNLMNGQIGQPPVNPMNGQIGQPPVNPINGQIGQPPVNPINGQIGQPPVNPINGQIGQPPVNPMNGQIDQPPVNPMNGQMSQPQVNLQTEKVEQPSIESLNIFKFDTPETKQQSELEQVLNPQVISQPQNEINNLTKINGSINDVLNPSVFSNESKENSAEEKANMISFSLPNANENLSNNMNVNISDIKNNTMDINVPEEKANMNVLMSEDGIEKPVNKFVMNIDANQLNQDDDKKEKLKNAISTAVNSLKTEKIDAVIEEKNVNNTYEIIIRLNNNI